MRLRNHYHLLMTQLLCGILTQAAPLNWSGTDFFLMTRSMSLAQVLSDLGANYNTPVIVSPQVNEIFVGTLLGKTPKQILDELAALYNLVWYFDGKVLHVYKSSEVKTAVIAPAHVTPEQLIGYLEKNQILDDRNVSIKQIDGFSAFEVFGVPACIERIQSVVKELDSHAETAQHNQEQVAVVGLKYAFVNDMEYEYRDQKIQIPGVISLLKDLNDSENLQNQPAGGEKLPGNGLTFSADSRHNAIIIKGKESQLAAQKSLIEQLDQKPIQVEISVTIMDVDVMQAQALGLQTQLGLKDAAQAGNMLQIESDSQVSLGGEPPSNASQSPGCLGNFSATIHDFVQFQLHLRALQREARAIILAQPSVITLNNMPAILDKSVTFYTKLVGKAESKVEAITTGTLLQVTPRVIQSDNPSQQEILLQIMLKDGRHDAVSQSDNEDAIPQVQNSQIITQAQLRTGEAILLGGFVREQSAHNEQGIPFLSKIPVLSWFCANKTNDMQRVVRLFLIRATPIEWDQLSPLSSSNLVNGAIHEANQLSPDMMALAVNPKIPIFDPNTPSEWTPESKWQADDSSQPPAFSTDRPSPSPTSELQSSDMQAPSRQTNDTEVYPPIPNENSVDLDEAQQENEDEEDWADDEEDLSQEDDNEEEGTEVNEMDGD